MMTNIRATPYIYENYICRRQQKISCSLAYSLMSMRNAQIQLLEATYKTEGILALNYDLLCRKRSGRRITVSNCEIFNLTPKLAPDKWKAFVVKKYWIIVKQILVKLATIFDFFLPILADTIYKHENSLYWLNWTMLPKIRL